MVKSKRGGKRVAQSDLYRRKTKEEVIKEIEDKTREDSTETASVIDENGSVLLEKTEGLESEVNFTYDELLKMQNNTLTHNHPKGRVFSPEDLDLAFYVNLREIRASHKNGCYSLKRNFDIGDSIPNKYRDFAKDYTKAAIDYKNSTMDAIFDQTRDAEMCNKMVDDFRRQWLKENAVKYGWTYTEETL